MTSSDFARQHILGALCAALAEADGYEDKARRLYAQTKLRMIIMSDDDVRELAGMLEYLPDRPQEKVLAELRETITEYRKTAHEWLPELREMSNSGATDSGVAAILPDYLAEIKRLLSPPES